MKKFICIIIALSLVFGSVLPVFAVDQVIINSYLPSSNFASFVTSLLSYLAGFDVYLNTFFNTRAIAGGNVNATFQDLYALVDSLCTWIIPSGTTSTSLSLWDFTLLIATRVNDLWGGWDSYFSNLTTLPSFQSQNYNDFRDLKFGLTNFVTSGNFNETNAKLNSHRNLVNGQGLYSLPNLNSSTFAVSEVNAAWNNGSPLGNIAYILRDFDRQFTYGFSSFALKSLTHYGDTLSTWDSQQDTLTQVNFTPDSAIHGLYRYLAYTQRDVARLAYVLASDEEIETREKARDNQTAVLDNFVDSNGDGSVSASNFGDIASASDNFKSNFNTGVSASNIWGVFDNSHYNWFTQQTKNQLDTTPQTRSEYATPLLDAYYEEIYSLFESDEER